MNLLLRKELSECPEFLDFINNDVLKIDNSHFSNFACPVKGMLGSFLKLRETGKATLALDYGTCLHAGLEVLMRDEPLEKAEQAFIAEAEKLNIDQYMDERRCMNRGLLTLSMWHEYRMTLPYPLRALRFSNGEWAVEIAIEKQLPKVVEDQGKYTWMGRIDAICEYRGKYWLVDHKSTSMFGEKFLDDKIRSPQFLGYYFLANELVLREFGKPLEGVLINAICTGTKEVKFGLYELPFQSWQVDEWIKETVVKMKNQRFVLHNSYYHETTVPCERETCVTKYGRCNFFEVCDNAPSIRENTLRQLFAKNDWSPLHDKKVFIEG